MMFWSVGPFWYMVYGIWYVVYGMKMAFTVYLHMFCVRHAQAVYNVVHLFLVLYDMMGTSIIRCITNVLENIHPREFAGWNRESAGKQQDNAPL